MLIRNLFLKNKTKYINSRVKKKKAKPFPTKKKPPKQNTQTNEKQTTEKHHTNILQWLLTCFQNPLVRYIKVTISRETRSIFPMLTKTPEEYYYL